MNCKRLTRIKGDKKDLKKENCFIYFEDLMTAFLTQLRHFMSLFFTQLRWRSTGSICTLNVTDLLSSHSQYVQTNMTRKREMRETTGNVIIKFTTRWYEILSILVYNKFSHSFFGNTTNKLMMFSILFLKTKKFFL